MRDKHSERYVSLSPKDRSRVDALVERLLATRSRAPLRAGGQKEAAPGTANTGDGEVRKGSERAHFTVHNTTGETRCTATVYGNELTELGTIEREFVNSL